MTDVYVSSLSCVLLPEKKCYFKNNVLSVIPAKHRTPSGHILDWGAASQIKYAL